MISENNETTSDDFILDDNLLICILTGDTKKKTAQEENLQSIIRMLNEEYGFELSDMERDFKLSIEDPETGKSKKVKVDLVVFEEGAKHTQDNIIRVCCVFDDKTKDTDKKKGLTATLGVALMNLSANTYGLWANNAVYHFGYVKTDAYGNDVFEDLSDFPGKDQTLSDLDRSDRMVSRAPAGDSMVKVFKRCHDYIYGNEGMKKTAFWELLNLIFCKIYDEKRFYVCGESGETYRRKFWVGVQEQYTDEGRAKIAKRIKGLFQELKEDTVFKNVFDGNEQINLSDKGLAKIASELAKYSFLNATVDVKGVAYETIVSNTLKQEAGQFFTPRNIIKAMVEMLAPTKNMRVLDPACGSGGFIVMVLDFVRKEIAKELYPDLDGVLLEDKCNSLEVSEKAREYAETMIFGFDFDPDLKKAARMNMVMAGDGHSNIFHINSLAYPLGDKTDELEEINRAIHRSLLDAGDIVEEFKYPDAREKFDLIFTNPPFGAKIPIDDPVVLSKFDLGHNWKKDDNGEWHKGGLSSSEPPEILFIDQCYQFLKPGGRMAIVLPDGILGNPNTEYVRAWILNKFKILASIDLAVEAFLPQIGVQASLLFLQKKTDEERSLARHSDEDYDVFMAIAEKLGKDRRGNPIYERDEDGAELLFDTLVEYLVTDKEGNKQLKTRTEKQKRLDDDLPKIARAYRSFQRGE